eukprot:SAG31_NODE_612_length_13548_cov_171.183285_11_plen_150_part_00
MCFQDYGLLDCATHMPTPDYFLALLWGHLMGEKVLSTSGGNRILRTYAHCDPHEGSGGVTVLVVNIGTRPANLSVRGLLGPPTIFQLTGSVLGALHTTLNGARQPLAMVNGRLPKMQGKLLAYGEPVLVPSRSVTFAHYGNASAIACGN